MLQHEKVPFAEIPMALTRAHWSDYSREVLRLCMQWMHTSEPFSITTSGSTGAPKPIVLSRALMTWSIGNTASALGLRPRMHVLHGIHVSKAGGLMLLLRALHVGMSLEVVEPSLDPLSQAVSPHFHLSSFVPAQVQELQQQGNLSALDRIETLLIGGASVPAELEAALQACHTSVYATYGMTETASHIALRKLNTPHRADYFTPMPEVTVTRNAEGCAVIHTPFHEALETNDLIEMCGADTFRITGRADTIINSGGIKILPEKTEALWAELMDFTGKKPVRFCAASLPDAKWGEQLVMLMEGDAWTETDQADFLALYRTRVSGAEVPKKLFFGVSLAFTTSGKIDRKASARSVLPD